MKIALEIKNLSKAIKPSTNNVIFYDGKDWYITTKDDIFKEVYKTVDKKMADLDKMIAENASFKEKVSSQILDLSEIIKNYILNKEN